MRALIERTDSFGEKSSFWVVGFNKQSLWRQLDDLQDCASSCKTGNFYNIIVWEEDGVCINAYSGEIISNIN